VLVAIAVLRAAAAWTGMAELEWWWWVPNGELFTQPSVVGWSMFLVGCGGLAHALRRRSHALVAATTAGTVGIAYLVMLEIWTKRPGVIIDVRLAYTIGLSLVPLYIALLALAAHVRIWLMRERVPHR
jgi:hypothetical protein